MYTRCRCCDLVVLVFAAAVGSAMAAEVDADAIVRELEAALRETVAVDTSALRSITAYHAPGGQQDAAGAQLDHQGAGGTVWVFWAHDAPAAALVPAALMALADAMPELAVFDVHMMGVMDWITQMHRLRDIKNVLETRDDTLDPDIERQRKEELVALTVAEWSGFTRMSQMRRQGGYLMLEDVSAAVALDVRRIPSFYYISPSSTIHRLEGLGQRTDLAEWIRQALAWEAEHLETTMEQVLP